MPIRITALVTAHDDEDVVGAVLDDLIDQGVHVHLLDRGSTDATLQVADGRQASGRLTTEALADRGALTRADALRRQEVLAVETETDWFVSLDAHAFLESPWPETGFRTALEQVDRLGYNAVGFAEACFLPIDDSFRQGDPRPAFRFHEPVGAVDRPRIRCWKKQPGRLDLTSTAGDEVLYAGRRVFPLRFVLRRYPSRPGARRPRTEVGSDPPPLREPSSLAPFDPWGFRVALATSALPAEGCEPELALLRAEVAAVRSRVEQQLRPPQAAGPGPVAFERCARDLAACRELASRQADELGGLRDMVRRLEQAEADCRRHGVVVEQRLQRVLESKIWRWTTPVRELLDAWAQR
jgi:hypothetical protein